MTLEEEEPQDGFFVPSCGPELPFFRGCEEKGIFGLIFYG